ncbi:MAG: hypothetical protein JNM93_08880 [Bacteriovoracaceae bacterium]|nr:hypothetical protein [Bacteriovoracaceae bacterium]
MHKFLWLIFLCFMTKSFAYQNEEIFCYEFLDITTDYEAYPGNGKIRVCTDVNDKLTTLIINKPVANPYTSQTDSGYYDERHPIIKLNLDTINKITKPIPFMRPRRYGIEVDAAWINLYKNTKISDATGGILEVQILKNVLTNAKHTLIFKLEKVQDNWEVTFWNELSKRWQAISSIHLNGSFTGVKSIDPR